jgi:hypothetical protein
MVSSTSKKVQFSGNGVTTTFAYSFLILDQSHIKVVVTTRRR